MNETTKNKKIVNIVKNLIFLFIAFMTGFIGSILIMTKNLNEVTSIVIHANKEVIEYVSFFGFHVMKLQTTIGSKGELVMDIVRSSVYIYIPFITGIMMVCISLILMVIVKKIINKKEK